METFNLICAPFSTLLVTRRSRHFREGRGKCSGRVCEWLKSLQLQKEQGDVWHATSFMTKQTGEINSFLLHYFGCSSVHTEAWWPAAAGTGSTLGARFLQVSTVLPCIPPARPERAQTETPGLPLSRLLTFLFGLQVHRIKRRLKSLFHLSAAFLGRKEPGAIWEYGEEIPKCRSWLQDIGLNPDETTPFFTSTWWSVSMLPTENPILRHPRLARYYRDP